MKKNINYTSGVTAFYLFLMLCLGGCNFQVLNPKGLIAADEKYLIIVAILLMLIVVIPVFIMTFTFAWRYRSSNKTSTYDPNWTHSTKLEVVWWSVPIAIISVLATISWITTHKLDPYRPLDVSTKPITIQAVALDWKWLFIYPEQHIATINYIQAPVNVPITFLVSADAPMNSIWIPQLGGQVYAMTGMTTKLHLIASEIGQYNGYASNYSGAGFTDMKFMVNISSQLDFNQWINQVKHSQLVLDRKTYDEIIKPSINNVPTFYSSVKDNLFEDIIAKFMVMSDSDHMNESMYNN